MKSLVGKSFSGYWGKGLDSTLTVYDTLSDMCQVSYEVKLKAVQAMLSTDALGYDKSTFQ